MFPERSITAAANSCRDPFGDGFMWCYVSKYSWEPCTVTGKVLMPRKLNLKLPICESIITTQYFLLLI